MPMIIGEIRRYLRDASMIRVSRSLRDTAYHALQSREKLAAANGREPSVDEIARDLGISRTDVSTALDAITDPVSLYDPVYSDGDGGEGVCVMDQVGDDNENDDVWLESLALRDAVEKLSDREKKILSLRFFTGRTQSEVAKEIGISQAQISRLEKGALTKIKKGMA